MAILTRAQVVALATAAGFVEPGLDIIVAIAQAESGFDTTATHTAGNTPPSTDRGILQINSYWHSEVTDAEAFDPAWSFRWAYTATNHGVTFTAWSTYNSGAYKQYLPTTGGSPTSLILANAVHFKEFYGGFTGTCGETALTVALLCAERIPDTHDEAVQMMLDITHQMQSMGWANATGASTLWSLAREAATKRGASIDVEWDYAEPFPHDWHAELLAHAGYKPIVVQVANAQALPGDESGVHYHFVCVVGRSTAGYIVADGDNWAAETSFQTYSYADFEAAIPCGILTLNLAPVTGGGMSVPSGWSDDGTALHNPQNKNIVVHGFRDFILQHAWDANDVPLENEFSRNPIEYGNPSIGGGVVQYFRESGQLSWSATFNGGNAYRTWNGQEEAALASELSAANGAVASLKSQVAADAATIAALQAKLAAVPPPVDVSGYKSALLSAHQVLSGFANADAEVEKALNG